MPVFQTVSRTIACAAKAVHTACCVGMGALLLTSCSTPPKPPSVDESTKRPVNARAAVDLKACQGDLSRATILVSELARAGVVATALSNLQSKSLRPTPDAAAEACPGANAAPVAAAEPIQAPQPVPLPVPAPAAGNIVAIVGFGLGSAVWSVQPEDAAALVRRAKDAAAILIRGRTDATGDSLQETVLARRRAEAAAEFLRQAGVASHKLRLTWQGAGDPMAGFDPNERAQSRRVEIEFYAALPVLVSLPSGVHNGKAATAASL